MLLWNELKVSKLCLDKYMVRSRDKLNVHKSGIVFSNNTSELFRIGVYDPVETDALMVITAKHNDRS